MSYRTPVYHPVNLRHQLWFLLITRVDASMIFALCDVLHACLYFVQEVWGVYPYTFGLHFVQKVCGAWHDSGVYPLHLWSLLLYFAYNWSIKQCWSKCQKKWTKMTQSILCSCVERLRTFSTYFGCICLFCFFSHAFLLRGILYELLDLVIVCISCAQSMDYL